VPGTATVYAASFPSATTPRWPGEPCRNRHAEVSHSVQPLYIGRVCRQQDIESALPSKENPHSVEPSLEERSKEDARNIEKTFLPQGIHPK
jgi:hypothetical protein